LADNEVKAEAAAKLAHGPGATPFKEFCDRASEPRAILKIGFATAIVGLIVSNART
jgi:hypothetical protein